ncbi:DEAD/DEAH box helicase [Rhodospira trueperi]|uniref:DEAD/DEAH box helicase n=1 Tax=Rhodospira trueperi TaxID=69960 RepID=UPI000B87FEAC|nr:DEAD/DEAH box helicase [Rhodospira trueperi]
MIQFTDLGLAEPLLRAIAAEGHIHPTPIQSRAIPLALSGRDVLGIAQTGTGKTAAFVLPLLDRFARASARAAPGGCRALILVPTRELAAQVSATIRAYGRDLSITSTVVIGGAKPGPQVRALARGVDIIVATPGRLIDHLDSGAVRLDGAGTVVLDEADHMLDLGFLPAIRRIMKAVPKRRQTMLLSATMPKAIRILASEFLNDPAEVSVAPAARPIETIDQSVMHVAAVSKRDVLVDVLGRHQVGRTIVFTRTKRGADRVTRHLEQAGLSAMAIHGNRSQPQRTKALAEFRGGQVAILVATDIAARGIDVPDVSHVINFDLPNVPEAYVHRIGRTARAGKSGTAISLCDPTEQGLLRDIERLIGSSINDPGGHGHDVRPSPASPSPPSVRGHRSDSPGPSGPRRRKRRRTSGPAVAGVAR